MWRGQTHAYNAPNYDGTADEFGDRQAAHKVDEWPFGAELGKVKAGGQPAVLWVREVEVFQ
jgi:hypothetical protein